jgi:hypothetical protein
LKASTTAMMMFIQPKKGAFVNITMRGNHPSMDLRMDEMQGF